MAEADRRTIAGGVPGMTLMEAAGRAVAEGAAALAPEGRWWSSPGRGTTAATASSRRGGWRRPGARCGWCCSAIRSDSRRRAGGPRALGGEVLPAGEALPAAALVVDALFGAGLDRPLEGGRRRWSRRWAAPKILAVDLPSGVHADTGAVLGAAVRADATVTFFRKKLGHLLYPGRGCCGRLTVADIGIDAGVLAAIAPRAFENGPALWAAAVRPPAPEDHKYRRGHALVVSGPMARTGAAAAGGGAALRAGAGLVTLLSPPDALAVNAAHLTAVMLRRLDGPEALAAALAEPRAGAVAIGPALGTGAAERALVETALAGAPALVLDADALTLWEAEPEALFGAIAARRAPTILTPHEGEFGRLFPDLADRSRPERARAAAARAGAVLILKGPDSVIAAPDGRIAINANAPPWLATAGSGDVLAGVGCGLLAQGVGGFDAACAAVWLHGAAGGEAGPGLTAEDLAPALRPVLRALWADQSG